MLVKLLMVVGGVVDLVDDDVGVTVDDDDDMTESSTLGNKSKM